MLDLRGRVATAPWWAKIAGKLILARLPVAAGTWQRLGLFRHGAMDDDDYALQVFRSHWKRCGRPDLRGGVVLELGPGDSIATAVIARAHGARAVLVDSGAFAVGDVRVYRRLADRLRAEGQDAPDLSVAATKEEVLRLCDAEYLTEGIASLGRIADATVDMVFSQAVLEHVRRDEFESTLKELARVLTPNGHSSHRVDLRDHLGGGLDNLRFSRAVWESPIFARGGFYTNRLSYSEVLEGFSRTHDDVETRVLQSWESPPLDRRQIAQELRHRTDDDLMVAGFDVLAKRPVARRAAEDPTLSA
jgi:SAM-dependent methyltransferase